jgi:hypothetical protein
MMDKPIKKPKFTLSDKDLHVIQEASQRLRTRKLEDQHRQGYERHPPGKTEFAFWEKEQTWGEE